MRLPDTAHTSRPWRIHELTGDFRLEDVWALPTPGGPDDFPRLVQWWLRAATRRTPPPPAPSARSGRSAGRPGSCSAGTARTPASAPGWPTLRDRLPADLREAPPGPDFAALPFTSLYLTGDEWAAEIVNRTVHGVLHLGWVPDGTGGYRGQMAVLVKPNGLLGTGYMAAIRPFRHLIVYPRWTSDLERAWRARNAGSDGANSNTRRHAES